MGILRAGVKPQEVLRCIGELQPDTRALADAMSVVPDYVNNMLDKVIKCAIKKS